MLIRVYTTQFGISIRKNANIIFIVYLYVYASARAYTTHCSYNALLDSGVLYYFPQCVYSTLFYNMLWLLLNALCVTVSALGAEWILATNVLYAFPYVRHCVWRVAVYTVCTGYVYMHTTYVFTVSKFIHRWCVIHSFHCKNQDLHEHQNLCECEYVYISSANHAKRFSIHVMSRMLISCLLQLLLFVRTYIYIL